MFKFNSCVRYSECNKDLDMTINGLVNYFQDTSTFQSESLKVGMEYLKQNKIAWVLSYWHIVIERMPKLGEKISVSTWPYELSGFMAHRNFVMKDSLEEVTAYANSLWSFVDVEKGKIKRIDDLQKELYKTKEAYPMDKINRKIDIPIELEKKKQFEVEKFFIDSNGHVNNEKYIQFALNYLVEEDIIREIRVEYKKQAKLGDVICPFYGEYNNKKLVVLKDENSKIYATVEFLI